ncbi:MAG TPA: class I SAM-dependent methyltransferase [Vicinamibacterales bacterium]|jgi:ubiquinone/menaquinone biosynthesis C-methylase UbiE|nr:class I SAM-dependent methyltransferase [Vicinamibacterales bacterium]
MTDGGFDRVAGIYRLLEHVAFGRTLQRARTAHLEAVRGCRDILVVGDGDGRCLEAIVAMAPDARVTAVDASAAMLARARRRVIAAGAANRVTFQHADVRRAVWPDAGYDAVVTMFVLDCFTPRDVEAIVVALARGVRPDGVWLFADFAIPERGWRRAHAGLVVGLLYAFFRWTTGIEARALPPSEAAIAAQGFSRAERRDYRGGLIRSVRFRRAQSSGA